MKKFLEITHIHGLKVGVEMALSYVSPKKSDFIKSNKIKIQYPYGNLKVTVDIKDLPFWFSLETKKWEPKLIQYLFDLSIRNQTVIEVGAWIGPITLLLSHLVGPKGRVDAFEPMPEAFKSLVSNLHLNNLTNVHPHNLAVSNVNGEVKLISPSRRNRSASMVRYKNKNAKGRITITSGSTTIDSFCKKNGIIPEGIKIDVEGAEGLVFKGATETINSYRPWIIVEFHGSFMSDREKKNCWNLLTKHGKKIIYVEGEDDRYNIGDEINKNKIPSGRFNVHIWY